MDGKPIEVLLARLDGVCSADTGWSCRCPAHDDRHASLSVAEGQDGRALVHCHAGCSAESICAAVDLKASDLFPYESQVATIPAAAKENTKFRRRTGDKEVVVNYSSSSEAIAELERRHGPKSASWDYYDASGELVGVIVRWDRPGGKDIRPVSRRGESWSIDGLPQPRPLYRLPELGSANRVFVCESEKAADAAASIGLVATTSPDGADSAMSAAWSPLAGKEVIILPGNDDAGRQYAAEVGRALETLSPPASAKVVELPGLPEHGDIVDWIERCHGEAAEPTDLRSQIDALIYDAEPRGVALTSHDLSRYVPFPVNLLPYPIRDFVRDTARSIGCDFAFVILPLLAALASAIGNTRRALIKVGWSEPCILWTAVVCDSGSQKSPALAAATEFIEEKQKEELAAFDSRFKDYECEMQAYEADFADWKRKKGRGAPPTKPIEPVPRRMWISDTTIEALADRLLTAPRGLLLKRDEFAGWLMSFDQYRAGKGGDVAHWLSLYNGQSMLMDRKTADRKTTFVPVASASVVGGIQLETLVRALGKQHFENGLAARLLLAYPPKRPRRWTNLAPSPSLRRSVALVFERLLQLGFEYDPAGSPRAKDLPLASDAKPVWIDYYNRHGRELADLTGKDAALWSKLEGTAARLALVIQLVRDPDSEFIDAESMRIGVQLADWFGAEGRRIYAILDEDDRGRDRRELVEYIEQHSGAITYRELTRGPRRYRENPKAAEAALQDLAKRGFGHWVNQPAGPEGGRPTVCFVLHGWAVDETSSDSSDNEGCVTVAIANEAAAQGAVQANAA